MSLLRVRPAKKEDRGFIFSSWFDSFRGTSAVHATQQRHTDLHGSRFYWLFMQHLACQLMGEPDAKTLVLCDVEDEDTLVGFAAASGEALHYVYIRDGFRRAGHARQLIGELGTLHRYTFQTGAGERRLKPRERGWIFTPRFTL